MTGTGVQRRSGAQIPGRTKKRGREKGGRGEEKDSGGGERIIRECSGRKAIGGCKGRVGAEKGRGGNLFWSAIKRERYHRG